MPAPTGVGRGPRGTGRRLAVLGRTHEARGGSACGASSTHFTPAAGGRSSRALESRYHFGWWVRLRNLSLNWSPGTPHLAIALWGLFRNAIEGLDCKKSAAELLRWPRCPPAQLEEWLQKKRPQRWSRLQVLFLVAM